MFCTPPRVELGMVSGTRVSSDIDHEWDMVMFCTPPRVELGIVRGTRLSSYVDEVDLW